jgi:hypothetical protein
MSFEITTAFVKQYGSNIYHLAQQKGSRLRAATRQENQKGESKFFDRIGVVSAVERTTRHGDTPLISTPHSRRRVTLSDFEVADLIDDQDKIRMLIDPQSDYVKAFMFSLGRSFDQKIISAALGSAYSGVDGGTPVVLPTSQKIHAVASGALSNLNVDALRHAKEMLDAKEVDDSLKRYIALTSSQMRSLLAQTEVTSSDYNTVKALVQGQLNTFLGFNFIRTELLTTEATALTFNVTTGNYDAGGSSAINNRICIAWAEDGIISSIGEDMVAKVDQRADKSYATQVYAKMSMGATRMEEEKVVYIGCKE